MSTKTVLVCDRCGAEDEKWKGPMSGGLEMRIRGWVTRKASGEKFARNPISPVLCDTCMRAFDEFMGIKDPLVQ